MFNVFSVVEEEAAEEIIEQDVYDYDSEVEPEDGESHEEAKLKTQEKDLVTLRAGYMEEQTSTICAIHKIFSQAHF